jgi:hypothetical protein
MRGLGLFFGTARRNDPLKLVDPRPIADYGTNDLTTGDAGKDGYTVLSRARPDAQGNPPPVSGQIGPSYRGPDQSFEQ